MVCSEYVEASLTLSAEGSTIVIYLAAELKINRDRTSSVRGNFIPCEYERIDDIFIFLNRNDMILIVKDMGNQQINRLTQANSCKCNYVIMSFFVNFRKLPSKLLRK